MERLTNSGTRKVKLGVTVKKLADRIADYENLEEQGLLLKLPCKAGDKVYCIENNYIEDTAECSRYLFMAMCGDFVIVTAEFESCDDFENQLYEMEEESLEEEGIDVNIFHKDKVFFTSSAAEEALKRINEESTE